MATATRQTRTFSIDKDVLMEIERTRGSVSASERVNTLLKAGLAAERAQRLHEEAAEFFATPENREERTAYQRATVKALSRK